MKSEIIRKIQLILEKQHNIVFAYVFGSLAQGKYNKLSDVDIAIYIKDNNLNFTEYLNLKRKLMDVTSREIDLVILNNAAPIVKNEVFKYGVQLFSRNEELESNFKVHSIFENQDMKKYRDLSFQRMIERTKREVNSYGEN